jgi:hypothetical protein
MSDIPLAKALLLWNSALNGGTPAFAVRPLGHPDYDRYQFSNGACFTAWRETAAKPEPALLARALVELWHVAAFYGVPVEMIHKEMLAVPEYRDMLADDCLPKQFQHEREG